MDEIKKDSRFAHITKDPRFRRMKKKDRKVTIDKRFHGMFEDKRFKLKYTVDKRGRPINATTNENLKKYYELGSDKSESSESESDTDDEPVVLKPQKKTAKDISKESSSKGEKTKSKKKNDKVEKGKRQIMPKDSEEEDEDDSDESSSDDDTGGAGDKRFDILNGPDYARGEGLVSSSSEEDEDEDDEQDNEEEYKVEKDGDCESDDNETDEAESEEEEASDIEHDWAELDKDAELVEDATSRLAVCNMDWDRIKAQDIMVLVSSFKPTGGVVKSVAIYPSEFGLKRLKEEDEKGPPELTQGKKKKNSEEDAEYHREKLRLYQMNRLKYYYAVVTCDSKETAEKIYKECDGIEYESSATRVDLRFIPEDMEFDQEPKSVAQNIADITTYKPSLFMNSALQQSKVSLTWDETDPDRTKATMRKFGKDEVENMNLNDYLASDSGSDEDPYGGQFEEPDFGTVEVDEEEEIRKMKELLGGIKDDKEDKAVDMEITWEPGLKEAADEKKLEKDLTPWDKYLQKQEKKKKEKKEKRKEKKKKLKEGIEESEEEQNADALISSDDDVPEGIDMNDPYFKEEYEKMGIKDKAPKASKNKKQKHKKLTPKEEEEKKQREAALSLLLMDEDDQRQHFSLKAIQEREAAAPSGRRKKAKLKKKKQDDDDKPMVEDTFNLDVKDPRFTDLYENPLFNIDPSAPEFKKTKAVEALIDEKIKRRTTKIDSADKYSVKNSPGKNKGQKRTSENANSGPNKIAKTNESNAPKDAGLSSLIKSVKTKTKLHENKKRR